MTYFLAVDIGASSGRHILGHVENGRMVLEEIYRFDNTLVKRNGHLCWDVDNLYNHILAGLRACGEAGKIPVTMGIDTWAVDFVLLDENGGRLGDSVAYRDGRTADMDRVVEALVPPEELYARTGIQKQPFNTIYQLAALRQSSPELLEKAQRLLMIPEYFHYHLTGVMMNEYTNATSTALVSAAGREWDRELLQRLGYPERLFGALHMPGTVVGNFTPDVQEAVGFDCTVVLPATHDTGSAYLAVPARDESGVFLSSGTWSLLGVENMSPITTEDSRRANFTNEGGYQYRYRYLKNIMGLWMIQSIRRDLNKAYSYAELEQLARDEAAFPSLVDANDSRFLAPDSMLEEVKAACRDSGQPVPETVGQVMQCVYNSLAACYAAAIDELSSLTGKRYTCLHIVGGGSKDGYLNALTARTTGLPVYAGPTEGTALGNLIVQFLRAGLFPDLAAARAAIPDSFPIATIYP